MKHPVGNGIPGDHNWSSTDTMTILKEPLGGHPELVKWSVSIVLTPGGWVGRVDNYVNGKTVHMDVEPNINVLYNELFSTEKLAPIAPTPQKNLPQLPISESFFDGQFLDYSDPIDMTMEDFLWDLSNEFDESITLGEIMDHYGIGVIQGTVDRFGYIDEPSEEWIPEPTYKGVPPGQVPLPGMSEEEIDKIIAEIDKQRAKAKSDRVEYYPAGEVTGMSDKQIDDLAQALDEMRTQEQNRRSEEKPAKPRQKSLFSWVPKFGKKG